MRVRARKRVAKENWRVFSVDNIVPSKGHVEFKQSVLHSILRFILRNGKHTRLLITKTNTEKAITF